MGCFLAGMLRLFCVENLIERYFCGGCEFGVESGLV
jgi:hypothetical protein